MQKAAFSIESYKFNKVIIDMANHTSNDVELFFSVKGEFLTEAKKYKLMFSVRAFSENKGIKEPFVYIECVGLFKFKHLSSNEEIPEFFYRNSTAILFPYVRAYVSIVTTQANVPGLILPTVNISYLGDELKKRTTVK